HSPTIRASTLSLHDALPISTNNDHGHPPLMDSAGCCGVRGILERAGRTGLAYRVRLAWRTGRDAHFGRRGRSTFARPTAGRKLGDRKSTRLNSSHRTISYAV